MSHEKIVPPALIGVELPIELTCRRGSSAPWTVGASVRIRPAGAPNGIYDGKLSVVLKQTLLQSAPGQLDVATCAGGSP